MTDNPTPNDIALPREALIIELNAVARAMELVDFHAREPDLDLRPSACRAIIKDAIAALAPGQHDAAAEPGLVHIAPEIDRALRDALFASSKQVAGPIMLEPSTEQAGGA